MIGEFVIVRTRSAGVHCGILEECNGTAALLSNVRRIWRWRGANSLNELANNGAATDFTRISEPVKKNLLTEALEIIPCEPKAIANLQKSRWGS